MSTSSFLPEDYLALKAERRTNIISLALFAVVMFGVFMAFLWTNQNWSKVKKDQIAINERYQQAGEEIQELTELEKQKEQMVEKAELASSLVERVPRSILLAELINRMPPRLALLEFEMKSEKVKAPIEPKKDEGTTKKRGAPARAKTKEEAVETVKKVEQPKYVVTVAMLGVAPTDLEVASYMTELNGYRLLRDVNLEYSEEKEIEGRTMRQFKINFALNPDADVRLVDPLVVPRVIRNPMEDSMTIPSPIDNTAITTGQDPAPTEER